MKQKRRNGDDTDATAHVAYDEADKSGELYARWWVDTPKAFHNLESAFRAGYQAATREHKPDDNPAASFSGDDANK